MHSLGAWDGGAGEGVSPSILGEVESFPSDSSNLDLGPLSPCHPSALESLFVRTRYVSKLGIQN